MKKTFLVLIISCLAFMLNQTNAQNTFRALSFSGYSTHSANPIGISPAGEYVVGMKWDDPSRGFIYDVAANSMTILDKTVMTDCTGVTSDNVVIGNHNVSGAKIWENEITTSLGIDGYVECITNDKAKIGGSFTTNSATIVNPIVWTKSGSTWNSQIYSTPNNYNGKIVSMSGDGAIATGWTDVTHQGSRRATIWKSPTEYILAPGSHTHDNAYQVSNNGKYVALASNDKAMLYVMDEDRFIPIDIPHPEALGSAATTVSNNGIVLGFWYVSIKPGDPRYGFIYSENFGYYDLGDFFDEFVPGVSTTPFNFHTEWYTESLLISGDGRTIAGKSGFGYDTKTWVLQLEEAPQGLPRPINLTLDVQSHKTVSLTWNAPETEEVITGYNIYHNDVLLASTDVNVTTYTYNELNEGVHDYSVATKYDEKISPKTNKVYADIYDMVLPFFENFDYESTNLATHFWKKEPSDNTNLWVILPIALPSGIQGQSVSLNSYGAPINSYSLVSRDMKAESNQNVFLKFALRYRVFNEPSDQTLYVETRSLDSDWQTVKSYCMSHLVPFPGEFLNGWTVETIDLSAIAKGKEFQFRFRVNKTREENVLWAIDNVMVDTAARFADMGVPGNPECIKIGSNSADFIWKSPSGSYDLTHYNGTPLYAIGNEGKPFIVANAFKPSQLTQYVGKYLTSVSAHILHINPLNPQHKLNVVVYCGNECIVNQPIASYEPNTWNTYALDNPVQIEAGKNYKIGIHVIEHMDDEAPISTDNSATIDKDGNVVSEDGGATWQRIFDQASVPDEFIDNLAIIGDITDTDQPTAVQRDNDLIGYVMFKDGVPQGDIVYQAKYTDKNVTGVENFKYVLSAYYNNGKESLNSDGSTINVSVKELLNNNRLTVYPNPTTGQLRIMNNEQLTMNKVEVYDVYGKRIVIPNEAQRNEESITINISHLPAGIYFLKIQTEQGMITKKIVKN